MEEIILSVFPSEKANETMGKARKKRFSEEIILSEKLGLDRRRGNMIYFPVVSLRTCGRNNPRLLTRCYNGDRAVMLIRLGNQIELRQFAFAGGFLFPRNKMSRDSRRRINDHEIIKKGKRKWKN